jgi:hypothetical protein
MIKLKKKLYKTIQKKKIATKKNIGSNFFLKKWEDE